MRAPKSVNAISYSLSEFIPHRIPHKIQRCWSSCCGAVVTNLTGSTRLWVRSLALLSGLRTWRCHELWRRSQMRLRSGVAVAVVQASSCSLDWTPSLGSSICRGCGPKRTKDKKKKEKKGKKVFYLYSHI